MKIVVLKSFVPYFLMGAALLFNEEIRACVKEHGIFSPISQQTRISCQAGADSFISGGLCGCCSLLTRMKSSDSVFVRKVQNKSGASVYSTLSPEKLLERAERELKDGQAGRAYISAGKALSLLIMAERAEKEDVSKTEQGQRAISIMRRAAQKLIKNNPSDGTKRLTLGGSY